MKFQDMDLTILKEYKSDARKHNVKGILEMLYLGKFMPKRQPKSMNEALKKLFNHIGDLDP